ncbi:pseudouridine synthase [Marinobacter litoralis]|uniref:pseudouridine synthase n=1 Tax=Marinobacter litoralis TaxID=187981 RepID=UPI0018EB6781|nr:16S rRNA pseudouridine(516) synthase [Marinobacter litoralis]MBJ6138967.1 16S rRNA pseudouridine(516) synthase [Marinobacter litoralis]
MKLSRIVSNQNGVSRKRANALIATGRVAINGHLCRDAQQDVSEFCAVTVDGKTIQQARPSRYLMLNKPAGYLSATIDDTHPTVLELIAPNLHDDLHIGGRLDRASTGLLILTNDGNWSRRLTEPVVKIPKVYRVTTEHPITEEAHRRFAEGIWFEYEQLTTTPAQIENIHEREARVTIYEGRYHQVKRMFHAVGNRVTSLHREQMGKIQLCDTLPPGQYRPLTAEEIASV